MARSLGYHRVRPALSNATRAKASIKSLEGKLADARRAGAAVAIANIQRELAWLIANSVAS